jgi:hypothetical protein
MSNLRIIILALAAMLAGISSASADSGIVRITFLKAGFVVGGAVGNGNLEFRGRMYRLSVGGLSYGFTFGGSQTLLRGRVHNINHPSDIEGVYAAGGAGATIGRGPQAIVLTNQKGAILELTGNQMGLMVNLDLSGMALTLQR